MFQFAHEHAARSRNFGDELLEVLALAVFVAETVEVRAVVGPVGEEEAGNLRVALQGRDLVCLALDRNAVHVVAERFEVAPDRESGFLDEGLDVGEEVLEGLLVLGAARSDDAGRLGGQQRVVRERHEHLVVDVDRAFFAVLELAVAESGIRDLQFFFLVGFLVEAVGEVVRIAGVRAQARVDAQRGILRDAVDRDGKELAGILVEMSFVVDENAVQVADGWAAHVDRANRVQELVTVLQHERSVFGTHDPGDDARVVVLFADDVVDELLCDFKALGRRPHGVDREFLEHQEADFVADVERFVAERGAAAADSVETGVLDGFEVLAELVVGGSPEAAFAPLLVVAESLDLENLVVQVEVALDAVELAEGESPHDGEAEVVALALAALVFHGGFDGEHVRLFEAPDALVALPVLDGEYETLRGVFAVELYAVLEEFVDIAARVAHDEAQAGRAAARVVEREFHGDAFLVHVRFHAHVLDKGGVAEDEVDVTENTSERVLQPRFADRHFGGVDVAVVGAFAAFAAEVDTAVRGAHVGDADAKNVFTGELDGLLGFEDEGGIGAEMRAKELTVEPDGGMGGDAAETQENPLGDLFFVVDGESFEIIGAILRHQEFFEIPFPDVRNLHGFGISGICRVPAVRNAQVVGVPNHFPIAVEAHNLAHSSVLYEILSVKIEF